MRFPRRILITAAIIAPAYALSMVALAATHHPITKTERLALSTNSSSHMPKQAMLGTTTTTQQPTTTSTVSSTTTDSSPHPSTPPATQPPSSTPNNQPPTNPSKAAPPTYDFYCGDYGKYYSAAFGHPSSAPPDGNFPKYPNSNSWYYCSSGLPGNTCAPWVNQPVCVTTSN